MTFSGIKKEPFVISFPSFRPTLKPSDSLSLSVVKVNAKVMKSLFTSGRSSRWPHPWVDHDKGPKERTNMESNAESVEVGCRSLPCSLYLSWPSHQRLMDSEHCQIRDMALAPTHCYRKRIYYGIWRSTASKTPPGPKQSRLGENLDGHCQTPVWL